MFKNYRWHCLLLLLTWTTAQAQVPVQDFNLTAVGQLSYTSELNDIWGYVDETGVEYALVGTRTGTSVVSLANPALPVELLFIPGAQSIWRDLKTWGDFAYVTTDQGTDGLLIIDLGPLPSGTPTFQYWKPNLTVNGSTASFNKAHNLYIDEGGYCYIAGSNISSGETFILDVHTTPGTPIYQGATTPVYAHDAYTRGDTLWTSDINAGTFSVHDVSNKTTPVLLASQTTPRNFAHNAWISDNGRSLFTTDEKSNAWIGSYDVSDLGNIKELDRYRTPNANTIPHNVHTLNDFLVTSYYTDGLVVIDASRPDNLVEVGRYDTYNLTPISGFYGAWGAYPYLPSGLVLVSDINTGLHILQPSYQRACWLEGLVTDQATGANLFGVNLTLLNTNVAEETQLAGTYKTGVGTAGTYDLYVSKTGYLPKTISVTLANGQVTIQNVQLTPAIAFNMTGQIVDSGTLNGIPNAYVKLKSELYEYDTRADANGNFSLQIFPDRNYDIIAGQWGHRAKVFSKPGLDSSTLTGQTYPIQEGYRDEFVFDYGWTEFGNASGGKWEYGIPSPVVSWRGDALPEEGDLAGDIGRGCLITGNNDGGQLGRDDVDDGFTTVVSPIMDLSTYSNRTALSFHYFINKSAPVDARDRFIVYMTNGTDTAEVFNTINAQYDWSLKQTFNITDYIALTSTVQVYFQVNDSSSTIVESLIDAFEVSDTTSINVSKIPDNWADIQAYPNPFKQSIIIDYAFENSLLEQPTLFVCNALGQVMEQRTLEQQAAQLSIGNNWPAGIYFVRIGRQSIRVVKQ
ncbi:MAG: choice-of-anchor B family protein [Aureispira sp.]